MAYSQIKITVNEVAELNAFMAKHKCQTWFIAKDQGAYVGASNGKKSNWIKYFRGCNPETDKYWWDNCQMKFGGDDFGEMFSYITIVEAFMNRLALVIKVTDDEISISQVAS